MTIMEERSRKEGRGSLSNPHMFLQQQDYQQLQQYCLVRGLRYIDDMFPPGHSSIGQGLLAPSDLDRVVWMRPRVRANAAGHVEPPQWAWSAAADNK